MNMPPPPPPLPPSDYSGLQGVAPGGRKLAQPWMRILARFLDAIIVSVVGTAIGAAIILSGDDSAGFGGFGGDISTGKRFTISLFGLAIGFVYEAVLTKVKGGTPMKLAFGMRVVRTERRADHLVGVDHPVGLPGVDQCDPDPRRHCRPDHLDHLDRVPVHRPPAPDGQ